jgi:hypothetical protein
VVERDKDGISALKESLAALSATKKRRNAQSVRAKKERKQ